MKKMQYLLHVIVVAIAATCLAMVATGCNDDGPVVDRINSEVDSIALCKIMAAGPVYYEYQHKWDPKKSILFHLTGRCTGGCVKMGKIILWEWWSALMTTGCRGMFPRRLPILSILRLSSSWVRAGKVSCLRISDKI